MKTHLVLTVQFQADMPSIKCNVRSLKEEYDVGFFSYMLLSKGVSSQNTLRKSTGVLCLSFRTRDISLLGHKPILSLLTQ